MRRGEKTPEAAERRVHNLKELIVSLDKTAETTTPAKRLEEFLDDITLDTDREEEKEAGDAVTLITMHSCKGLEFPHVFIVGHGGRTVAALAFEDRRHFRRGTPVVLRRR